MASIEYLMSRVEGKKTEIEKLQKKLDRIVKAQASGWTNNPYYYDENDLKWTQRDIEKANKALADYEARLQAEQEKAGSRNVQVIIDFLEQWKAKSRDFYEEMLPIYIAERDEYYAQDRAFCDWFNSRARIEATNEERKAKREEWDRIKKDFNSKWSWIMPYVTGVVRNCRLDTEKLEKDLKAEADRKYDFIIERTNAIVGQITDASYLRVSNGELNGVVTGTKGKASIMTIGAGGWNIQRYHFRTLVREHK